MRKLLLIDDDVTSCRLVTALLRGDLLDIVVVHDAASGKRAFAELMPDIVLLDLHLPDDTGLSVLEDIRRRAPLTPVLVLTADRDVRHAVQAVQLGATDYLTKPITGDELPQRIRRELARSTENARGPRTVGDLFGPSELARTRARQVEIAAQTDVPVLLSGESGSGKAFVAETIHRASARWQGPFIAIDSKQPPRWLRDADAPVIRGATLYFGGVGNLEATLQAKLLRLLEGRDVRVIAGTSKDLHPRADGPFGPELYFRLAQFTLALPPLRGRPEDIDVLARRCLAESTRGTAPRTFAPASLALLGQHDWPGNMRELRSVIHQAVLEATDSVIGPTVLTRILDTAVPLHRDALGSGRTLKEIADDAAREAERHAIAQALRITRGNKSQAARMLKTDYKTLHLKMRALGIDAHAHDDD